MTDRVKLFDSSLPDTIERSANRWIDQNPGIEVLSMIPVVQGEVIVLVIHYSDKEQDDATI